MGTGTPSGGAQRLLSVAATLDMGTHMKTTVDISDPLLADAKAAAARDNTTLRALIEEGLRLVLADKRPAGTFKLRDCRFHGGGLTPEFEAAGGMKVLREAAYGLVPEIADPAPEAPDDPERGDAES
jgi:hypothetical protein